MIYHLGPNIQRKIWGGRHLEALKGIDPISGAEPIGETWEISIHPDGPSFYQGEKLVLDDHEQLPYLVKLLDTGDNLSVQVHPGDEYARMNENSSGKTECWVVIRADKNSGIYLGLKSGVTRESFEEALTQKRNMSEFLNFYKVSPGDFFFVPAGSIHAIGAGILLAEVQQSSGITYRVWDWNRLDSKGNPRELHVKKSLDVINFDPSSNTKEFFQAAHGLFASKGKVDLVHHDAFKLTLVNLEKGESLEFPMEKEGRLPSILNLTGEISVNSEVVKKYSAVLFKNENVVKVSAHEKTSFLFLS